MKLSQFSELCQREWMQGRGDVVSLALAAGSRRELAGDVLAAGDIQFGYGVCGAGISEVVNPVTRSVVKIGDAEAETAGVSYGPDAPGRTVALLPA